MPRATPSILFHLRTMAGVFRDDVRGDPELLERFAETHDETAFATLTVRHGPLVWRTCRRILGNTQDTEDAYQVVFLALAAKAKKIHIDKSLAGWLLQVAHRTAWNARKATNARGKLQTHLKDSTLSQAADEGSPERDDQSRELLDALHSEMAKMPEKLRVALVLHYLEGKTQPEVAKILGVKESAVWSRLARGRIVLEKRLSEQGLAMGAAAIEALLVESASYAAVPTALVSRTVQAAMDAYDGKLTGGLANLAQEVLKRSPAGAPWWKTGWMITVLCVTGLGVGAGGIAWKTGFFATKADGPLEKHSPVRHSEKEKPKSIRRDLYGDPLPTGALARLGTVRFRHNRPGEIVSLTFTPDGKGLVTAGQSNPPRLWDATTGKVVRQFSKASELGGLGVALSADGRFLACRQGGSNQAWGDGPVSIWETATGKLVRTVDGGPDDHRSLACAFSPNGKTFAHRFTFLPPRQTRIQDGLQVLNVESGRKLWLDDDVGPVCGLAFSPKGDVIAVDESDPKELIVLRDAHTGRRIGDLQHPEGVRAADHPSSIAFSPDGGFLIANLVGRNAGLNAENNRKEPGLYLWHVKTGKKLWYNSGTHGSGWRFQKFSPDGKFIAAYDDGALRLLDAVTGKEVRSLLETYLVTAFDYSPDGRVLAAILDSVVHFFDPQSGKELTLPGVGAHEREIGSARFLSDANHLVSTGSDGRISLWDTQTGRQRQSWTNSSVRLLPLGTAAMLSAEPTLSSDGRILATCSIEGYKRITPSIMSGIYTNVNIYDVETGKLLRSSRMDGMVRNLSISPKSDSLRAYVWSSPSTGSITLQNLQSGREIDRKSIPLEAFCPRPLFCPNGRVMFTVENRAKQLSLWDVATGKKIRDIGMVTNVLGTAISPDRSLLAIVGEDYRKIALIPLFWGSEPSQVRVGAPRLIGSPLRGLRAIQPLAFSPDNKLIASEGDEGDVHIWEVASGKERRYFSGHMGNVTCLCFSADARRLVSGSEDTTLLVWDVTNRMLVDGSLRPARLPETGVENLWKQLGDGDAARAGQALWELVAAGKPAASLLERYLRPAAEASPKQVDRLIAELDSKDFPVRRRAHDALANMGEAGGAALRKELTNKGISVEALRSLQGLLDALEAREPTPKLIHELRAVEVLEQIGTLDAERLLRKLAAGATGSYLTQAAQGALQRLDGAQHRRKERIIPANQFQSWISSENLAH